MDNTNTMTAVAPENRTFAILAHVSGLLTSWLGPLVLYLIKKSDPNEAFAASNAKEALNFQITMFMILVGMMVTVVGIFLIFIPMIYNLVCCIMAAVKASNGQAWRYPLTLRLIK